MTVFELFVKGVSHYPGHAELWIHMVLTIVNHLEVCR